MMYNWVLIAILFCPFSVVNAGNSIHIEKFKTQEECVLVGKNLKMLLPNTAYKLKINYKCIRICEE